TVNIATILIIIFWSLYKGFDSNYVLVATIIAQAAFILFLVNLNMYFIFLLIRKSKSRKVKVKLAQIAKRMMKYHIPIATTASFLIVIHAVIMITTQIEHLWKAKTASGIVTFMILSILLYSGLLRRWKASGKRRKFHY